MTATDHTEGERNVHAQKSVSGQKETADIACNLTAISAVQADTCDASRVTRASDVLSPTHGEYRT
jgi:hypothetical protein